MSVIRVAVAGSEGKMGRTVCEAVEGADGLKLSGRFDTATGGTLEESLSEADVMVDFTTPDSALPNAKTALDAGVHVVVGTTGFDLSDLETHANASTANVFVAPNFAIGAVLMMEFAKIAARSMSPAEIIEFHHEGKLDRPSGTAARTRNLIEEAGGVAAGQLQAQRPVPGGHREGVHPLGGIACHQGRQHRREVIHLKGPIHPSHDVPVVSRGVEGIRIEGHANAAAGDTAQGEEMAGEVGHLLAERGEGLRGVVGGEHPAPLGGADINRPGIVRAGRLDLGATPVLT